MAPSLWCISRMLIAIAVLLIAAADERFATADDRPFPVWVVPSLDRARISDAPGTIREAVVAAARGEYESFQVVAKAPEQGLNDLGITLSDLMHDSSDRIIGSDNFRIYREHYVHVSKGSPNWKGSNQPLGPGMYADGLIPLKNPVTGAKVAGALPEVLPGGAAVVFWVDLHVPKNAAAGRYRASFALNSSAGTVETTVHLTVWDFTLPDKPALRSHFAFWQAHSVANDEVLLDHRLNPSSPADCNRGAGGGCLAVQATQRHLMNKGLNSLNAGLWSGSFQGHCEMKPPPGITQLAALVASYERDLFLYNFTADEIQDCPHWFETLRAWGRQLHAVGLKNLVTMRPYPELFDDGSGSGEPAVDVWVMLPVAYTNHPLEVLAAKERGFLLWSYNAAVQDAYSPKWQVDFLPINYRIHAGYLNAGMGFSGLLYWRIDLWHGDPWTTTWDNTGYFSKNSYPGEGMLVYPGKPFGLDGVLPSMRLKQLRDGVDDFDYFHLLKQAGQEPWALNRIRTVASSWETWSQHTDTFLAIRSELGEKLSRMAAGRRKGSSTKR